MKNRVKIVTIGSSSTHTSNLIEGFINRYEELPVQELWLVDVLENKDKLENTGMLAKDMFEKANLPIEVHVSFNQKEALVDADYVLTELHSELKSYGNDYGAQQVFSALYAIPTMFEIINDMKALCEEAWLINIANPAGIISEAVFRYAEFDRYIGVCNIPSQLTSHFANELNVKPKDLIPYFAGLNHMSYALNVYHKNKDKLPQIISRVKDANHQFYQWNETFIKELGVYPSPYHQYYYHQDESNKALENYFDNSIALCCEVAINIINSIYNDKRDYQVVNTINDGHMTDLPDGCAIEITSRITKDGPVPVHIGRLPIQIRGLIQTTKAFEELLVDAIYEKDLKKILLALQVHPTTKSIKTAEKVFEAFIGKKHLFMQQYEGVKS
jgi:6-phospho-beta-glucosidase